MGDSSSKKNKELVKVLRRLIKEKCPSTHKEIKDFCRKSKRLLKESKRLNNKASELLKRTKKFKLW